MKRYVIEGVPVDFPFDAYECQRDFMSKVRDDLIEEENCGRYCVWRKDWRDSCGLYVMKVILSLKSV